MKLNSYYSMSLLKLLFIFGFSLNIVFLQGCSFLAPYTVPLTQGTIIKQENVDLLQAGLTKGQVQELLGPVFGENMFNPKHWKYVFYTTDTEFHPDAISHLIVQFDRDGYLEHWKVYDRRVELN